MMSSFPKALTHYVFWAVLSTLYIVFYFILSTMLRGNSISSLISETGKLG